MPPICRELRDKALQSYAELKTVTIAQEVMVCCERSDNQVMKA